MEEMLSKDMIQHQKNFIEIVMQKKTSKTINLRVIFNFAVQQGYIIMLSDTRRHEKAFRDMITMTQSAERENN